jgi:3-hydroxyacyl-CoA dehydrogenase / enoyl-CoA hydratase / 3-hydroxybutyryl-CoA epimerase
MPGAGGTQRVGRLANPQEALQMLPEGRAADAGEAKAMKLVDAVVPAGELIAAAKDLAERDARERSSRGTRTASSCPAARSIRRPAPISFRPANALYRKRDLRQLSGHPRHPESVRRGTAGAVRHGARIEARYFATRC